MLQAKCYERQESAGRNSRSLAISPKAGVNTTIGKVGGICFDYAIDKRVKDAENQTLWQEKKRSHKRVV
ncbi:MAG TPA: hypothetical protein DEG92_02760 [Rikenellaceae bacterium]|nr:hypothetical protein [Rikenellaceae bacterium]